VARVFVSHASQDHLLAAELHDWLTKQGHNVFLDQDLRDGIVLGEDWEQRLYERLRWADAVLCLITASYCESAWCTAEVGIARFEGCRLLPLQAQPGQFHPLLMPSRHQYTDWVGDPERARHALGEALRRMGPTGGWDWPGGLSPFPGLRRLIPNINGSSSAGPKRSLHSPRSCDHQPMSPTAEFCLWSAHQDVANPHLSVLGCSP
jgi:hypothetical protein